MTITALPTPPSTSDPSTFNAKADALLSALPTFVTEANAVAVAMNLNSTTDTSASSVAIGTGSKSFTVSTGKSFQPGMFLVIADTAAPSTNSMYGQITSYNTGTGALVVNVLSVLGSGTKTAWTISQTSAANLNVDTATTATTATTANRVDSGEVTVTAHATTGDIFAAAANSILWDDAGGAITTTIFPNAPKAGMTREGRCNGASKFTAGANLLIEGVPSGTTITLADGALFKVRAITTSQFKMTYSVSGTFTATGTGFTVNPTSTAAYTVMNGIVTMSLGAAMSGTSNATTFTITGAPACCVPSAIRQLPTMSGEDAGASTYVHGYVHSTGGVINLFKGFIDIVWTNSGQKALRATELSYHL